MALRKTALAAALMGLAGAANAGSLATSVLEVQDFTLLHSDGSVYAFSDFELLVATNSADVFADLDTTAPASDGDSDTVGVPAGNTAEIDLGQVCVGSGCAPFGENDFSQTAPPATTTYALADQELDGISIELAPGDPVGANASTRADVSLFEVNEGTAGSNVGLTATLLFALNEADSITFEFDALGYLAASLDNGPLPAELGTQAEASYSWVVTIEDVDGDTVFAWSPDGVLGSGIVGGSETADDFSLNDASSRNWPIIGIPTITDESGSFAATTGVLEANEFYTLTIRHETLADARFVPEPSVLALLGTGLLGMGFVRRRQKRA